MIIGGAIVFSLVTLSGIGYLSYTLTQNNNKPKPNNELTPQNDDTWLSKDEVKQKFNPGGDWENKTTITPEDFQGINKLTSDAFDDIPFEIEEIILPHNIYIADGNNGSESNLKWPQVKKISSYNTPKSDELTFGNMIKNNIFFNCVNGFLTALTIADRIENTPVVFPSIQSFNYPYDITSHFYQKDIFKNVPLIKFENSNSSTQNTFAIGYIGKKAFKDCQILEPEINLPFDTLKLNGKANLYSIFIMSQAFDGSNIKSLKIIDNNYTDDNESYITKHWKWTLMLDNMSFANCINLKKVELSCFKTTRLGQETFANVNEDFNVKLINTWNLSILGSNAFKNTYQNFNLEITAVKFWIGKTSLSNISVDIEQFSMYLFEIYNDVESIQEIFRNSGLTEEQFQKIKWNNLI